MAPWKGKDASANAGFAEGLLQQLQEQFSRAIDDIDIEVATQHVRDLRAANPEESDDALVERLIRDKCLRAGAVGAVTSGAAIVPGIGTFASLTVGVAADIGATFKLQSELVLEVAAARNRALSEQEKRTAVMLITGVSGGANQLVGQVGKKALLDLTERYAQRWVAHALPVVGVGATAAVNAFSTYVVGKRADAYMTLGEVGLADWMQIWRSLSGVDEREIGAWLAEGAQTSWAALRNGVASAASRALSAGSAAGTAIASGASTAAEYATSGAGAVVGTGKRAGSAIVDAGGTVLSKGGELASSAGSGVVNAASTAGQTVSNAASSAASTITGRVSHVKKRVGGLLTRRPTDTVEQSGEGGSQATDEEAANAPQSDEAQANAPIHDADDVPGVPPNVPPNVPPL